MEELNEAPEVVPTELVTEIEVKEKKKAGRKAEEKFVPSDELKKKVFFNFLFFSLLNIF